MESTESTQYLQPTKATKWVEPTKPIKLPTNKSLQSAKYL